VTKEGKQKEYFLGAGHGECWKQYKQHVEILLGSRQWNIF